MKQVQLSHGGGGEESNALIKDLFYRVFHNDILIQAEDAAVLQVGERIAFTTDSFTVSPLFFKGGNIGTLAVAGTVNDLAMVGAKPLYLSTAFMIEEGLSFETLETIVETMAKELKHCGARVVCGDTKVVPRGSVDQLFINTTGIGAMVGTGISAHHLEDGDAIIVSRDIGRHGATILMEREHLQVTADLHSDCHVLWPAVAALLEAQLPLHALRDATRGGLSAVLNEWAMASGVCVEIQEADIPMCDEVRGVCELFGFEGMDLANEGTFIIAVPRDAAEATLEVLKAFDFCHGAAIIGQVTHYKEGKVVLHSAYGSRRYLELPKGELLPRIC